MALRSFTEICGFERETLLRFREISLSLPGVSALPGGVKFPDSGGAFHYEESGKLLSVTSNRFIHCVQLVETSLDTNLLNNAVRLKLCHCSLLPGGVSITETLNNVIILLSTNQSVHRLLLPHPARMYRSSIFTDVGKLSLQDSSHSVQIPGGSGGASCSTCWISDSGEAHYALASPAGGIMVLTLPPHDSPVVELKRSSMMQRFSDWIPSAMRGDQGGGGALSLAVREVEDNCFLFALSQDLRLRLWSFRDQACVLEADLLEYMPSCRGARSLPGHGHRLRLSLCSTGLCLGVYLAVPGRGQFTVLQLVSTDSNRYSLDHVSSLFTTQETLVDFTLTPTDIWAVWVDESNATVPAPEDEVHIGVDQDPRETYLEVLFSPLRFTASAILKALQIFRRGSDRDRTSDVSWESLKKEVTVAVESELQSSVTEFEFSQEEYRQLQVEFWSKFYACCLQYQEALSLPLGLSVSPGTGMALLLKKGFVSFLLPCFAVDHLYLSYDEYLSSEEETPIAEELGRDVLQLVQCLRLVSDAVSVEMAYEMEKALEHLQSPERAADLVLESLLSNDRKSSKCVYRKSSKCKELKVCLQKELKVCLQKELKVRLQKELKVCLQKELKVCLQKELKVCLQKELKVCLQKELKLKVCLQKELKVRLQKELNKELKVCLQKELKVCLQKELKVCLQKELKVCLQKELKVCLQKELKVCLQKELKVCLQKELKKELKVCLQKELKVCLQKELKVCLQKELKVCLQKELKVCLQKELKVENLMEDIQNKLQDIRNPAAAMTVLLRELDLETDSESLISVSQETQGQPLGVRISLSQLYGSSSAVSIVCQAVCHMTMTRALFCRDMLILQKLYLRLGDNVFLGGGAQLLQLQQDLIPRSSNLLSSYHLLKHISQSMASSVALDIIEANLQHLTVLELSDSPSLSSASVLSPQTVVDHMISNVVVLLAQLLWPSNPGFQFPECLMANCQYTQLQEYVRLIGPWCQVNIGSCRFVLGQCYLANGEGQKALQCFQEAATEVEKEDFLLRLTGGEEEDAPPRLQYYNKVLRLLEDVGLPELVIQLSSLAITEAGSDAHSQAALWTRIFKHHLDLGHNSEAYEALTQNPDSSMQLDCLRQLVVVLCERSQLQDLVHFSYVNLHDE
ncbi:Nuclear pore complex protein Nup160, partial [Dissostichus eleginoides]